MIRQTSTVFGIVMLLGLFSVTAVGSNLVTNGSFEGGTYVPGGTNGDIVANGWLLSPTTDVSMSHFDIESTPFQAEDGTNYAAFMSAEPTVADGGDGSQDCFVQVGIPTIAGQLYSISFWVAITAAKVDNTLLIPVWNYNDPGQVDMTNPFYSTPTNTGPVGYQQFTFIETASTNSTGLMFHGRDASGAILLDNVVVTQQNPVPETTSLLLMGSGLLIVGLLHRRKK